MLSLWPPTTLGPCVAAGSRLRGQELVHPSNRVAPIKAVLPTVHLHHQCAPCTSSTILDVCQFVLYALLHSRGATDVPHTPSQHRAMPRCQPSHPAVHVQCVPACASLVRPVFFPPQSPPARARRPRCTRARATRCAPAPHGCASSGCWPHAAGARCVWPFVVGLDFST